MYRSKVPCNCLLTEAGYRARFKTKWWLAIFLLERAPNICSRIKILPKMEVRESVDDYPVMEYLSLTDEHLEMSETDRSEQICKHGRMLWTRVPTPQGRKASD